MRPLSRIYLLIIVSITCSIILPTSQYAAPAVVTACDVCVTEFRTRGPGTSGNSTDDEFVEIYNNTDNPINIGGYKLRASDGTGSLSDRATVPANTTLPARGHYLFGDNRTNAANGNYVTSPLGVAVPPDQTYGVSTADNGGFAIVDSVGSIHDQVGLSAGSGYLEGTPLAAMAVGNSGASNQFSYTRKIDLTSNQPIDTDNNSSDFVLVVADTSANVLPTTYAIPGDGNGLGLYGTQTIILGAPGPERLTSPTENTAKFTTALYDATKTASQSPNRCYDAAATGGTKGALFIRRNITNNTAPTSSLQFRVVDITTASRPAPAAGQSIIKPVTSTGSGSTGCPVSGLQATTLATPSNTAGGGLNSVLTTTAIPAGATQAIEFKLAADATGAFRFLLIFEAK